MVEIGGPLGPVVTDDESLTSPPVGPVIRRRSAVIRAGTLGCGEYRVTVEPRGGGLPLMRVDYTGISYSRVLNEHAELQVGVAGVQECSRSCPDFKSLDPYRHEMVVWRNDLEVARGPLVTPELQRGVGTMTGQGMSGWLAKRVLHRDHTPVAPTDASVVAVGIVSDAMQPDSSPGLVAEWMGELGVKGQWELKAFSQLADDALRSVQDSGLYWTCLGRTIYIGPPDLWGTDITATLRAGDWTDPPKVTGLGVSKANRWYVVPDQAAAESDEEGNTTPVLGAYEDTAAALEDGLLEAISSDPGVTTQADADTSAKTLTLLTRTTPRSISDGTLGQDAPVTMDKLIPGRLFRVELQDCYPTSQVLRLNAIRANASPGSESVSVTFEPTGRIIG